jgi:type II secretory pathway predicted ATPase ExeA
MFLSYYNLKGTPFEKSVKKENLFKSNPFKEFISRMEYMKLYKGIILLVGASGVGKTTALRAFIEDLKPEFFKPVYLPLATVTPYEFYQQLNWALGGDSMRRKCDLFSSIQNLIMDYATIKKQIPVIIFDEAHFLRSESIYELQMLFNFNLDSVDPVIIILSGQPHMREKLLRPSFSPINQRLRLKYEFPPLGKDETKEYICHNLKLVGCNSCLFNDNALEAIYNISSGVLRIINNLATKALIYGAATRQDIITEEIIYKVSSEL